VTGVAASWLARRAVRVAVLLALLAAVISGCGKKTDDGTAPRPDGVSLPALVIRDDTPELLLTWIDGKGDTHVELHPPDVPAEGRSLVRVVVSDREEGTRDLFYVADLGQKQGDGSYATRTMSRRQWEDTLEVRRREYLAKISPPPPTPTGAPPPASGAPSAPPVDRPPATGVTVIIYGADWCKPCHQAAEYLARIGVAHVVKDVEEDGAAAREMSEKLARVGRGGSSIPVIDVGGQILVGYNKSEIDRALRRASQGTVL
jgi:glutaredoxin